MQVFQLDERNQDSILIYWLLNILRRTSSEIDNGAVAITQSPNRGGTWIEVVYMMAFFIVNEQFGCILGYDELLCSGSGKKWLRIEWVGWFPIHEPLRGYIDRRFRLSSWALSPPCFGISTPRGGIDMAISGKHKIPLWIQRGITPLTVKTEMYVRFAHYITMGWGRKGLWWAVTERASALRCFDIGLAH